MPVTIEDPKTGNSWTINTDDPDLALRAVENSRAKFSIPANVQLQVRQPATAPEAAIQTNEQGNVDIAESPNFPEMNVPGEAMGSDMLSVGPNEKGKERTKDMSLMQKLGRMDQALAHGFENQFTLGRVAAMEPKLREDMGPGLSSFLLGDKPMDQMLEEGSDLVGNLPMMAAGTAGFAAGPGRALPSSWLLRGAGAKGVAARTAAAPVETVLLNADDAAARGEEASPTEGTATAVTLQAIGELLGKGIRTGGTKIRQKGMPKLEVSEEKMAPAVREWLKNVPYGPSAIPNADIRTQLGADIVPLIREEGSKAPRALEELKSDATARRQGELGRAQETQKTLTGQTDTAAGQAQAFKDQALDPNIVKDYTEALKSPFPNTSVQTKTGKMIVPIPFKNTLTSSPRFYEAWVKAGEGPDGGLANAEIQAYKRGVPATKAEIAWHTIQKLNDMGDVGQELSSLLKKDMGKVNPDLGKLVKTQADLWQQHRGAQLGEKIYANPANLDKGAHQVLTDPAAMQAAGDAFVAKFVEASSKGDLPKLTEQMRTTANELLGKEKASKLFRQYDIEVRSRKLDEPLSQSNAGISPEALTKAPGKFKQALGALTRVLAASPGGPVAMLGAAGPAAARFLRDHPQALSGEDVQGLFSLLRKQSLGPEPVKNRPEKFRPALGTGAGTVYTGERRRDDRQRSR